MLIQTARLYLVDKYCLRPLKWKEDRKTQKLLLVGPPGDLPGGVAPIKIIYSLDEQEEIRFVGT